MNKPDVETNGPGSPGVRSYRKNLEFIACDTPHQQAVSTVLPSVASHKDCERWPSAFRLPEIR